MKSDQEQLRFVENRSEPGGSASGSGSTATSASASDSASGESKNDLNHHLLSSEQTSDESKSGNGDQKEPRFVLRFPLTLTFD